MRILYKTLLCISMKFQHVCFYLYIPVLLFHFLSVSLIGHTYIIPKLYLIPFSEKKSYRLDKSLESLFVQANQISACTKSTRMFFDPCLGRREGYFSDLVNKLDSMGYFNQPIRLRAPFSTASPIRKTLLHKNVGYHA